MSLIFLGEVGFLEKVWPLIRLGVDKSSLRFLALAFVLALTTGCSSTSTESQKFSPLEDIALKLTSGTCEYLNGDKNRTVCTLKVRLKNNGQEPVPINGKFRFEIATYDFQVRYAQYKENENEGFKTINAPEVFGLYDGVVGTSDIRIDDEINPLQAYNYTVAVIVPTGTIIQYLYIKIDKNADYASESIGGLPLNVCTFGDKSGSDSQFFVRGYICEKGKAKLFDDW